MTIIDKLNKNITDYRNDTLEIEYFLTGTIASYDFFKSQYPENLKKINKRGIREEEKEEVEIFKNLNQRISTYESDVHTVTFINKLFIYDCSRYNFQYLY